MTYDDFAEKYCETQEQTPEGLYEVLEIQHKNLGPAGWVLVECQMMGSSYFGNRTILPYGGKATLRKVPDTPVSPQGLASDMSVVIGVLPVNSLKLTSVSLPAEETRFPIFEYPHQWRIQDFDYAYDGDTVKVVISRGFKETKEVSVRIYGVDTPEKTGEQSMAGKVVALVVNDYLQGIERKNDMYLVAIADDKYFGRVVGSIFWKGEDGKTHTLGDFLRKHGFTKPYFGETKEEWTKEELREVIKRGDALL
jgi:hypothetical protein